MPRASRLPADARRRQIIETARQVFATQSYWHVGTADLARAAGVSEPALYRYFRSKKELFLAAIRATRPRLLDLWQEIAYQVEDPLETLWAIGVSYYDHLRDDATASKLQFRALSEADDGDTREALRENYQAFVRFVAETLEEGKRRGIVRAELDSWLMAWQFLGIGLTLDLMHALEMDRGLDRSRMERWQRSYLAGVRAREGAGRRYLVEPALPLEGPPGSVLAGVEQAG